MTDRETDRRTCPNYRVAMLLPKRHSKTYSFALLENLILPEFSDRIGDIADPHVHGLVELVLKGAEVDGHGGNAILIIIKFVIKY